jgi:hypothetical protein
MHTFVRAIHYEQHQQQLKNNVQSQKDAGQETSHQGAQ